MSSRQATLAADIWGLLKDLIPPEEHAQAADALVNLLLDSDLYLDDIGYAFAHDPEITDSVNFLREDQPDSDEEDFDSDWDTDEE
jgi:hypothetical protein